MGFSGKRRKGQGAAAPPFPLVRIGLGKRGPATFPSPPLPSPFLPSWWSPTRTWSPSRTPHPGRTKPWTASSSSILYIQGQGAPHRHTIDQRDCSLAVCGAPLTIFHLGHIVAVLRR